jgi:hypothetical protein
MSRGLLPDDNFNQGTYMHDTSRTYLMNNSAVQLAPSGALDNNTSGPASSQSSMASMTSQGRKSFQFRVIDPDYTNEGKQLCDLLVRICKIVVFHAFIHCIELNQRCHREDVPQEMHLRHLSRRLIHKFA